MNTAIVKPLEELNRLRNRHVAKLLDFIGDPTPVLALCIKKQFTMFANDVEENIIRRLQDEYRIGMDKTTQTDSK